MPLTKLNLDLQWIGDGDGPTGIRTNDEPGLKEAVLAGKANVGWGQPVRFNLDPEGTEIGAGPGVNGPFPVISWRVRIEDEEGILLGEAELNAYPDAEGDVNERNLPIGIGCRAYDETHGYALLVRGGWRRSFTRADGSRFDSYKPASSGRLKYTVYAFYGDIVSNAVSFFCS